MGETRVEQQRETGRNGRGKGRGSASIPSNFSTAVAPMALYSQSHADHATYDMRRRGLQATQPRRRERRNLAARPYQFSVQ